VVARDAGPMRRRLEPAARLLFQKRFNDVARRRASLFVNLRDGTRK